MKRETSTSLPVAVTVAGSDSGGGAGIQADLLTFAAHGVYGTTVITSLTAQNPREVRAVEAPTAGFVRQQLEAVHAYFPLAALKTGMLYSREIIEEVAAFLERNPGIPSVVDPVMVATSGAALLQDEAMATLREKLLPRANLLTPNLDEATLLWGNPITNEAEMSTAATALSEEFQTAVLLKGGHMSGESLLDLLVKPGKEPIPYPKPRIQGVNTHGSGCTLASAIAAQLALGEDLESAVTHGLAYLQRTLQQPLRLGEERFLGHFPNPA